MTLRQPSFHPSLLNLVHRRYPGAGEFLSNLPPCLGMRKFLAGGSRDRIEVYLKILSMIGEVVHS